MTKRSRTTSALGSLKKTRYRLAVVASILALGASSATVMVRAASCSNASECAAKISGLQAQNDQAQSSVNNLADQADNYQRKIDSLKSQIGSLQKEINKNLAKQAELKNKIDEYQRQIDIQKKLLGNQLSAMYVDGNMSSIELLASSKNLSDYVDKQEYRNVIQDKIQTTLNEISKLQVQLKVKKDHVDNLVNDLNTQRSQLDEAKAEQAKLLSYNQAQQNKLNSQIAANNARLANLRAQRASLLASITGAGGSSVVGSSVKFKNMTGPQNCGGGYRYCYAGLDQYVDDPWGFHYARECVHYVLDRLDRAGKYIPQFPAGGGDASNWVPFTTSVGAATLVSHPKAGDVVYMPLGDLGHVGMVDWVNSDGTVHVSQFNWYPGMYNTMDLYITPGVQFLRFHN